MKHLQPSLKPPSNLHLKKKNSPKIILRTHQNLINPKKKGAFPTFISQFPWLFPRFFPIPRSPSRQALPAPGRGASQVLRDHQHRRRVGGEVGVGDVLEAPEDAADHLPHVLTTGDQWQEWRMGWLTMVNHY